MAFPALHPLEDRLSVPDAICSRRGFGGNLNALPGLLTFPSFRKRFDIGHEVSAVFPSKRSPRGHTTVGNTSFDRVLQVFIERQCACRGGATFKDRRHKITRFRIDEWCGIPFAIA